MPQLKRASQGEPSESQERQGHQDSAAIPERCFLMQDGPLLLHTLSFLGQGSFLYVACVSKRWCSKYLALQVATGMQTALSADDANARSSARSAIPPPSGTTYTNVVASPACLLLAHDCGLDLQQQNSPASLAAVLGAHASIETIALARRLGMPWQSFIPWGAATRGRLAVLRWLIAEQQCPWSRRDVARAAALAGSRETLQWLWESEERRWDSAQDGVGNVAALMGHTELLAWLNSIGALTDETLAHAAASHGHTETLKWVRASGFACGPMAVSAAAQGGHVAAFKWLVDANGGGCTVGPTICTDATFGGSVELLEWLRDHGMGRWDAAGMRSMLQVAGLAADPATARWLRDQGAPWPSALYALAVTSDRAVAPPHGAEDLAAAAEAVVAQPGNTVTFMCWRLPALRWAIAAGAPWGTWSAVVCRGLT